MLVLAAEEGPNRGAAHALAPGESLAGRDVACAVPLFDERASRQHARVTVGADGAVTIEDLGSRNGTLLNGLPLAAGLAAALPESLLESELFGHERGAFTGAVARRKGLFEVARGGTLLLDEVGELPASTQPKLLRALESGEVRPLGATEPFFADVRLTAATNRDLRRLAGEGRFREDLYFRIAVVTIELPPLRERAAEILGIDRKTLYLKLKETPP